MKTLLTFALLVSVAAAAALKLENLPPAVQKTVQEQLKGGAIKTISKETEKGVTQYEIESMLAGKHRDFNVDTKGNLVVMEEEVAIDTIPAAARAAIEKKVGAGTLGMVETIAKPGAAPLYEAAYTSKDGKKRAVLLKADGTETKN